MARTMATPTPPVTKAETGDEDGDDTSTFTQPDNHQEAGCTPPLPGTYSHIENPQSSVNHHHSSGKKRSREEDYNSDDSDGDSSHNNHNDTSKKGRSVAPAARSDAVSENANSGVWDEDLHKEFVASIFEVGLRNSSPAVISENMTRKLLSITSERIKSKLQKYRNNKEKSRQEFLEQYEAFLIRLKAVGSAGAGVGTAVSPMSVLEMMGTNTLLGGDVAAYLSFAVMQEEATSANTEGEGSALTSQLLQKGALEYLENFGGAGIPFPELSEEEKKSSLGVSMTFVMGLFLSMTQHLMREREAERLSEVGASRPGEPRQIEIGTTGGHSRKSSFSLDTAAQTVLQQRSSASSAPSSSPWQG